MNAQTAWYLGLRGVKQAYYPYAQQRRDSSSNKWIGGGLATTAGGLGAHIGGSFAEVEGGPDFGKSQYMTDVKRTIAMADARDAGKGLEETLDLVKKIKPDLTPRNRTMQRLGRVGRLGGALAAIGGLGAAGYGLYKKVTED